MGSKILLRHTSCGKPAFYVDEKLQEGEIMDAHRFTLLDGTTPLPNTEMLCGSCKQGIIFPYEYLTQEEVNG